MERSDCSTTLGSFMSSLGSFLVFKRSRTCAQSWKYFLWLVTVSIDKLFLKVLRESKQLWLFIWTINTFAHHCINNTVSKVPPSFEYSLECQLVSKGNKDWAALGLWGKCRLVPPSRYTAGYSPISCPGYHVQSSPDDPHSGLGQDTWHALA